jgi:acid stress chaperone HdeB
MRTKLIVSALALALFSVSSAQAQTTIDVSKITCGQFVHSEVGPPRLVAAWLSGFYNGKQDNRIFVVQNFQANLGKLEKFCFQEKNFKLPVMQAVEELFGAKK